MTALMPDWLRLILRHNRVKLSFAVGSHYTHAFSLFHVSSSGTSGPTLVWACSSPDLMRTTRHSSVPQGTMEVIYGGKSGARGCRPAASFNARDANKKNRPN
jgi:hypothetical protein